MITIALIVCSILLMTTITQVEASRNITAFVHFNGEALKQDTNLDDAWYTVDGKNYSGWYYDMSDAIYGDSSEPNTNGQLQKQLVVADNASKVCFEEIR